MGLLDQLGVAEEATYGDPTVPTRFVPFKSETLGLNKVIIEPEGLRAAGRAGRRGAGRKQVGREGGGQITFEVSAAQFGVFLKHALGAVATSTPVGATSAREHLFTLGPLRGKSLTIQKGIEGDDGTVTPFNLVGSKIRSLTLSAEVDGYVMMRLEVDARDVQGAATLPLEVAVYADAPLFSFDDCSLAVAAGANLAKARSFEVTFTNQLTQRTATVYLGNGGLKGEPRDDSYPAVTGTIGLDFDNAAQAEDAINADTALQLTFTATGEEIEAGFDEELTVDLGDVRLGAATPQSSGPGVPQVSVPFACYEPTVGQMVSVLLRNDDVTP